MGIKSRLKTLHEILSKNYSSEIVDKAIERVYPKLAKATKCESFFSLPFNIIQTIVKKYFDSVNDFKCKDSNKTIIHLLQRLFSQLSKEKITDSILLLNSISIQACNYTVDDYITVIGSITLSPFCKELHKLYEEDQNAIIPDTTYAIEEKDKVINRLRNKIDIDKACISGDYDEVDFNLNEYPDNINYKDNQNNNLLHFAAHSNNPKIIDLLVNKGLSLNSLNYNYETPLLIAVSHDNADTVRSMIEHGSPLDNLDKHGDTALHIAAKHNNFQIVQMLLDAGADKTIMNGFYKLPINLATDEDVVRVLSD